MKTPIRSLLFFFCCITTAQAATPITVTVKPLRDLLVGFSGSAPATVVSLNDSRLSADISARVLDLPVKVGDVLNAGKALAKLDCRNYSQAQTRVAAELKATQARRDFAVWQLERTQVLAAQESVSAEILQQRKTDLAVLNADIDAQQADLRNAQDNVARCVVSAPFRGVVLERLAQVGEMANPGTPLLRFLELDHLEVSAPVQLTDLAWLESAEQLYFEVAEQTYPLKVRSITPAVETTGRSREVRFEFTDKTPLPGMAGQVIWQYAKTALPATYVQQRDQRLGVFVIEGQQARFKVLNGAKEGRPVVPQLAADSQVIVDGRLGLRDGDPVKISE